MKRTSIVALVSVFGFTLVSATAAGAETDPLWPTFSISAGAYEISANDSIRVDASTSVLGTAIDLDADARLGDSKTLAAFGLDWAFANRHSLRLRYYSFDREGSRRIGRVLRFRDVEFPIDARLETDFEFTTIETIYSYWFVRKEDLGVASSFGLVYLTLDASVSGTVIFGPEGASATRSVSADSGVPVPMIGLDVKGSPFERLILYGGARYLPKVQIGDIEGEAASYSLGAEFYVLEPLALGLSYDGTFYKVDLEESRWRGSVDLTSNGFKAYLRASF